MCQFLFTIYNHNLLILTMIHLTAFTHNAILYVIIISEPDSMELMQSGLSGSAEGQMCRDKSCSPNHLKRDNIKCNVQFPPLHARNMDIFVDLEGGR